MGRDWRDVFVRTQSADFVVVSSGSGAVLDASESFGAIRGRTLDDVMGAAGFFDAVRSGGLERTTLPSREAVATAGLPELEASIHEVRWRRRPALLFVVDDGQRRRQVESLLAELAEFPRTNPGPVLRLDPDGAVVLANEAATRLFQRADLIGVAWPQLCEGVTAELWNHVMSTREVVTHEAEVADRRISFAHVFQPLRQSVFVFGSDVTQLRSQERQLAEQARFPDMNPGPVLRLDLDGRVLLSNIAARQLIPEATVGASWPQICPGLEAGFWESVLTAQAPLAMEARIRGCDFQFTHRLDPGRNVFVYGADVTRQKAAERAARDSERLATLGTLAAGVAHELNNPAAAARRAAGHLTQTLPRLLEAAERVRDADLPADARARLGALEHAANAGDQGRASISALERADREDEVLDWLRARGLRDRGDGIAEQWVRLGFGVDELEQLGLAGSALGAAVNRIAVIAETAALVDLVHKSTGRVSEIALALKRFTFLGQAEVLGVDIHQGLEDTLLILGHELTTGPAITRDYAAELPLVWGMGSELNQVWMNLVDNAIDAAGPTGTVVLRTRASEEEGSVRVDVEDDGPGIPADLRPRVFEPFFTTKPPGSGTGLGLATTWSIVVDRHHGKLAVDSEPGRTVFTVVLPVGRPSPEEGH